MHKTEDYMENQNKHPKYFHERNSKTLHIFMAVFSKKIKKSNNLVIVLAL